MNQAEAHQTSAHGADSTAGGGPGIGGYQATSISMSFGGTRALIDAGFDSRPGEVHALLGANGAGKSTLVKILGGVLAPQAGELVLDGRPVSFRNGREANDAGVAMVSQELSLFPDLTVLENLFLMREPLRAGLLVREADMRVRGAPVVEAVGVKKSLLDRPLSTLSLGARQLVEIARALLQDPRVLILDEPTSALKAADTRRLLEVVREVRNRGVAVVLVSHFLEDVFEVSDVLTVLRGGRVVDAAVPVSQRTPDAVIQAMLGRMSLTTGGDEVSGRSFPVPKAPAGLRPLVLVGAASRGAVEPVSMQVAPGEILGLAGLEGSGASELLRLLFGQLKLTAGTVTLPSGRRGAKSMTDAARAGIAYVPADRKLLGLHLEWPIYENVNMVTAGPLKRLGLWPTDGARRSRAAAWREPVGLVMRSVAMPASALSGGNQQKVVFAKWLETAPTLVLLDDPTRGVDVGAKADMMTIIRDVAAAGRVVLYTSTDLDEMARLCDRVIVFYRGRAIGELRTPLAEHLLFDAVSRGVVPT